MQDTGTSLETLVRALREQTVLTQEEVAERSGLSVGTVRGIEAGRIRSPRSASLRQLAEVLTSTNAEREQLLAAARSGTNSEPAEAAIRRLPPSPAFFTGRTEELRSLDKKASCESETHSAVAAITGIAGVGKSALAVHWAYSAAADFPDGQIYLDLRGFGPRQGPTETSDALFALLELLQVPTSQIPVSLDARIGMYRAEIARRKMLLVLDNARNADQVQPLLPGGPETCTLITSRNQLTGLLADSAAKPVPLSVLRRDEAREMLAAHIETERVEREPEAAEAIIDACAGLPLALSVAAARVVAQPHFSLSEFATQLACSRGRLEALSGPDSITDTRTVFSWSYDALTPDAAWMFRLLSLHPATRISLETAASLAGMTTDRARTLLTELTDAHLLDQPLPARYECHDLLRAYGAELN